MRIKRKGWSRWSDRGADSWSCWNAVYFRKIMCPLFPLKRKDEQKYYHLSDIRKSRKAQSWALWEWASLVLLLRALIFSITAEQREMQTSTIFISLLNIKPWAFQNSLFSHVFEFPFKMSLRHSTDNSNLHLDIYIFVASWVWCCFVC